MISIINLACISMAGALILAAPAATLRQDEEPVPFETVVKYFTNGPRQDIQAIITTKREWKKIWKRAHSNFDPVPPLPQIDFSRRMIIVVSVQYLPDPSHNLSISKVTKTADGLKVLIKEVVRRGPGCGAVPDVLVHPLHIVEADLVDRKLRRKAEFALEQETVDCPPPQ
jgi:hypothetical protein